MPFEEQAPAIVPFSRRTPVTCYGLNALLLRRALSARCQKKRYFDWAITGGRNETQSEAWRRTSRVVHHVHEADIKRGYAVWGRKMRTLAVGLG